MLRVIRSSPLLRYSLALLGSAAALLFVVPGLRANLWETGARGRSFMTHEQYYLGIGPLVWTHFLSDFAIGLSCVAISLTLAYLAHRARRDIPFRRVFVAFGLFVIACGSTHFMEVWTTFGPPRYWLAGYLKLIAAVASLATAVVLPPLVPKTLAFVREAKLSGRRRSEVEAANRELATLRARVKELDELKTRFFANVSHELRTPLTLILGPAQKMLAAPDLTDAQRRTAEEIERNARALLKHVNDLLDISKPEAGRVTVGDAEQPGRHDARGGAHDELADRSSAGAGAVAAGDAGAAGEGRLRQSQESRGVAELALAPLVLVVEDSPEMNRFVAEALAESCRVESAYDAREGLEKALALRPDLILTDLTTPGESGRRLVSALRRHAELSDVPVLMLTAKSDEELRARLLREGAQDFLTKPFHVEELRARVENLIEVRRTRRVLQAELESQSSDLTSLAAEVARRRREMQAALDQMRSSNRTLEAIIEASPLAIVTLDEEAQVRSWNAAAERIFGWTEGEVLGKPLPTIPEELREEVLRNHRAAVGGKPFHNYETRRQRKDGARIDVSISTAPLGRGDGPRGVVALVEDITERRRAEAALRFQAHLLDTVNQAVVATDLAGRITYWNRFAEELYGWKAAEVVGRNVVEVTPAEGMRERAAEIMARLTAGESWSGEFTLRRRDGTEFPAAVTDTPVYSEAGEVVGVVGVSTDITERRRAEGERARLASQIEGERRRLKELVANVPGVVWEAWGVPDEASQRIDFVSDYVETMLGYTVEEWTATPNFWLTIVHPEDRERAASEARDIFASRRGGTSQFRWQARDGRTIHVEAQSVVICDERGHPVGMRGVTMDITERKQTEAALRASERRFRALVEQSPFSTQIFAPDGRTARVNPAWEQLWGVKLSDIPDYNILEDQQLEERGILRLIRRAFAGEATRLPPIPYDPPTGEYAGRPRWVQAFIYPVKDERGEVREVVLVHEDVSVRLRAEQAVAESRRLLQVVTDSAPLFITYCDAERRFQFVNEAYARRFGLAPAEAVGRRISEVVGAAAYESFREHVDAALAGRRVEFETEIPYESLGSQFIHADYVPHRDEGGEVRGFVAVISDVTERRRAEEAQKFIADATTALASSLDYEATLDAVAHMAVAYGADYCLIDLLEDDGRIRRLATAHRDAGREAAWREMQARFPLTPDSAHTVVRVLRTGRAELFTEMDDASLAGAIPDPRHREELRRLGVRSSMSVPLVARGRIVGAVTFISAESGRSYGELELRLAEELARRAGLAVDNARLYRRAQEANRAKDEFLATLSHELRTPLTPIVGWVHLMRGGEIEAADLAHGLSVIEKNSQALSHLINDLLDMSAILNHKMRLDREPVALDSVIRQAAETIGAQAERRGVRVEAAEGGEPLTVAGDRTRLAQVFWNLLSNAVKFSHEGGRVRVRAERDGEWARVHVEDEGIGIAAEFLPRVFDRFQQADMSTTKQYGGLGIGLALVRSFVEAHGGTVSAASAGAGRGATFTVHLPLYGTRNAEFGFRNDEQEGGGQGMGVGGQGSAVGGQPSAAVSQTASAEVTRPSSAVRAPDANPPSAIRNPQSSESAIRNPQSAMGRVLLVEDAADTLEMLRVFLGAHGYEVTACQSAADALAVAAGRQFDIIVSDIGLPNTDGYELLRRLRKESPHLAGVPAVALTGYAAPRDIESAREAGFAAHVAKPFEPAQLAERIARLLAGGDSGDGGGD